MNNTMNTQDRTTLARRLASALNQSFEAYMNDYSTASLRAADNEVASVKADVREALLSQDDLVVNKDGVWVVKD